MIHISINIGMLDWISIEITILIGGFGEMNYASSILFINFAYKI